MALPANNASFQKGNLSGFSTKGLCKVFQTFDAGWAREQLMPPLSGEYFAVLDGCGLRGWAARNKRIDAQGERKPKSPQPADFLDRFRVKLPTQNGSIAAGHGSSLSCKLSNLPVGGTVRFAWAFATTQSTFAQNACLAAFRFVRDGAGDPTSMKFLPHGAASATIGDELLVLAIERQPTNRLLAWAYLDVTWAGATPFTGKIEWLVCSGHFLSSSTTPFDSNIASCFPACLLVDHVRLT